jgi:hypothetical protein
MRERPVVTRILALSIIFLLFLPLTQAWGQAGPPGEVLNQARKAATITPSDSADLALGPTRFVYVGQGTACAIAMILADDTAAVTFALPAGTVTTFLPVRAKRVMSTATTCTPIVGLW